MYHIKQDKRAETSANLICGAVLELIKTRPFADITITQVQQVSSVSRSTFYRNFDTLEDVLALLCDKGFNEIVSKPRKNLPVAVFRYWMTNSNVLEALVSINRADILQNSLRRCIAGTKSLQDLMENEDSFDYLLSIISGGMIGILVTWVEHGKRETQDEVLHYLYNSFAVLAVSGILDSGALM